MLILLLFMMPLFLLSMLAVLVVPADGAMPEIGAMGVPLGYLNTVLVISSWSMVIDGHVGVWCRGVADCRLCTTNHDRQNHDTKLWRETDTRVFVLIPL
jgi:hypothetical protein